MDSLQHLLPGRSGGGELPPVLFPLRNWRSALLGQVFLAGHVYLSALWVRHPPVSWPVEFLLRNPQRALWGLLWRCRPPLPCPLAALETVCRWLLTVRCSVPRRSVCTEVTGCSVSSLASAAQLPSPRAWEALSCSVFSARSPLLLVDPSSDTCLSRRLCSLL